MLAVVVLAGAYIGYVAVRHAQPVSLPAPTGAYPVGRTMVEWTDTSRADPLAPRPGAARELAVWLWYPAATSASDPRAPYAPGPWRQLHLPSLPGLGETSFDAIRDHSVQDAPVAAGRFPVVVLEPGLGFAAFQYTTIAENLASHGYIVAGVTPTYSANATVLHGQVVHASDTGDPSALDADDLHEPAAQNTADHLLQVWADDARFTAEQVAALDRSGTFADHVDATRTAYIGHSFGGAASLQACHDDPRCTAAANLDGTQFGPVVHSGLRQPMLTLASDDSCVTGTCRPAGAADRSDQATARTFLAASTGSAWTYQITGMRHVNFSDYDAYYLAAPLRQLLAMGPIHRGRGLTITNAMIAAFLDHTLRDQPTPLLTNPTTQYPEVHHG